MNDLHYILKKYITIKIKIISSTVLKIKNVRPHKRYMGGRH